MSKPKLKSNRNITPKKRSSFFSLFIPIFICTVGFAIYAHTFNVPFELDDEKIFENPVIRTLWNTHAIWDFSPTRFFTYFSLAFNYHLHQLSLPGYHIFNLTVHLITALLVYWFILLLFSTPALKDSSVVKYNYLFAFFGGIIFVSHPVQTEAVTYIIQRTASLATLFYLASCSLYFKARLNQTGKKNHWIFWYTGSVFSALLALFTKEITITLPFILLLCEISFFSKRKVPGIEVMNHKLRLTSEQKRVITRIIPFFVILLANLITIKFTKSVDFAEMRRLDQSALGVTILSPGCYLLTQFRVIVTYLRLLLIPINQNLDYDYPIARTLFTLPVFSSLLLIFSILTSGIFLFRKNRLLSFSIFWFFLTLTPESSIIPIKDVIFEHRLYLPMVGYSIFLPVALYFLLKEKRLKTIIFILVIMVAGYSALTYKRNQIWKDELTLWNDVVQKSPNKARPYNNRGLAYGLRAEYEKAINDFTRMLKIDPNDLVAYTNRGLAYVKEGNYDRAIADYTQALKMNPNEAEVYYSRGLVNMKKNEYDKAIADFLQSLKIEPENAKVWYNLSFIYQKKGMYDQAIKGYSQAIRIEPNDSETYNNRGIAYYAKNEYQKAIADFNKAIEINPALKEARENLNKIKVPKQNISDSVPSLKNEKK